jgi:hypothetical protein
MLQTRTADGWGYFEYCARSSAKVSKTGVDGLHSVARRSLGMKTAVCCQREDAEQR